MTTADTNGLRLLSPGRLGALELPNRIIMAPMTRNRAVGTVPNDLMAEYYRQRAGAGLIVTEATQVTPQGVGYPNTPGIHSRDQIDGWKKVISTVHEAGGRIFLQLWHVGRISHPSLQPDRALPVAPSAIRPEGEVFTYEGPEPFVEPRALETAEIPGVVEQFRQGAANARAAGFDGVEIHGANGYLVDQFLRNGSNHREDEYGGSIENRCRLLLGITDAVVSEWGADRVGMRLSPLSAFNSMSDSDPESLYRHAVTALGRRNLAYLHVVSQNDFADAPESFDLSSLRGLWPSAYMLNGGYDRESAEKTLQDGGADFVSFGRLYLANPDLPERFARNAPLNEGDPASFYGGGAEGFTDYPTLQV